MDVVATVLPLVGVALGTLGTLTGQYLATRGAARRHADERAAKKVIELVCSHELSTAAHAYVRVLHNGARGTRSEREQFVSTRGTFMEAARRELGVEGPPLYRY